MDGQLAIRHVAARVERLVANFAVDDQRLGAAAQVAHPLLHLLAQEAHPTNLPSVVTIVPHKDICVTAILPELLFNMPPRSEFCYVGSSGWPDSFRRGLQEHQLGRAQFLDWISPHPVTKGRQREKDAYLREMQKRGEDIARLLAHDWPVMIIDMTCIYSRTDLAVIDAVLDRVEHCARDVHCTTRVLILVKP